MILVSLALIRISSSRNSLFQHENYSLLVKSAYCQHIYDESKLLTGTAYRHTFAVKKCGNKCSFFFLQTEFASCVCTALKFLRFPSLHQCHLQRLWKWATVSTKTLTITLSMQQMSLRLCTTSCSRQAWWYVNLKAQHILTVELHLLFVCLCGTIYMSVKCIQTDIVEYMGHGSKLQVGQMWSNEHFAQTTLLCLCAYRLGVNLP